MLDTTRHQAGPYGPDDADMSEDSAERSLAEDIKALVADGRLLAEAEIDFHKKRAIYGASEGRGIATLFGVAGVLAFFAVMALVVGLVLALGQIITYWGSTAVVTGALLVLALIFASKGKAKLARLKMVLSDEDPS